MTWFVDTNVLAYAVADGPRRPACLDLLHAVAAGDLPATTNTLVIEELWHLETRLTVPPGTARLAIEVFPYVVPVGDWVMLAALDRDMPSSVGTADRVHAATCRSERLDGIISADKGFDDIPGLVRVEPDAGGVSTLLAGRAG